MPFYGLNSNIIYPYGRANTERIIMHVHRRDVLGGIGAASAALLVGGAGVVAADDGEAALRVAHASPDAPAVDVLVNGSVVISDLAFRDVSP